MHPYTHAYAHTRIPHAVLLRTHTPTRARVHEHPRKKADARTRTPHTMDISKTILTPSAGLRTLRKRVGYLGVC